MERRVERKLGLALRVQGWDLRLSCASHGACTRELYIVGSSSQLVSLGVAEMYLPDDRRLRKVYDVGAARLKPKPLAWESFGYRYQISNMVRSAALALGHESRYAEKGSRTGTAEFVAYDSRGMQRTFTA